MILRMIQNGLLALLLLCPSYLFAAPEVDKSDFQAAFCLHVAQYVRWPDSTTGPLRIGVWKSPATFKSLTRYVATKTLQGRPLVALDLRQASGARDCDMVFVGNDPKPLLAAIGDKPIMTIGLDSRFLEYGGVLRMVPLQNRIGFKINLSAAKKNGIQLGSQLLNLALKPGEKR